MMPIKTYNKIETIVLYFVIKNIFVVKKKLVIKKIILKNEKINSYIKK